MPVRHCKFCQREFKTLNPLVTLCPDCRSKGKIEPTSPDKEDLPGETSPGRAETQDHLRTQSQATLPQQTDLTWGTVTQDSHPTDETQDQAGDLHGKTLHQVRDWRIGDSILDTYEVKYIFTSGGMGLVYRVHHKSWNTELVMKSPRPEVIEKYGEEDFVREANTWVELGLHPNIVTCYYVRKIDDLPCVFAEYVEGGSLKDWIEDQRLYEGGKEKALERILDVAIQFAWGLQYAHAQGLVHQDVKPGNVLMTLDGLVKVSDFGLAKARAAAGGVPGEGELDILVSAAAGTPAFRSPEQAHGERLSPQTDIWSWGLSILQMFAGELFWRFGEAAAEVLEDFLREGAQNHFVPAMPERLAVLLRRCFQPNPADRPADLQEIAKEMKNIYRVAMGRQYQREAPEPTELRASSLNNKALSMIDLGKSAEAQALFQQALEADPLHPEATYHTALLAWRRGEIEDLEVVLRLERLLTALPDRWPTVYLLALVHFERGDYSQAANLFQNPEEWYQAQTSIEQAKRILPESSWVRKVTDLRYSPASVVFHPDGKSFLVGQYKSMDLRDTASFSVIRTFAGHSDEIHSIAFRPDGRYALSSSADQTIRLWEVSSGKCPRVFVGHQDGVTCAKFSPDGRYVLSGSKDQTLRLWEAKTGLCSQVFEGHEYAVQSVTFSPDGRLALSASDYDYRIWEIETGSCIKDYTMPLIANSLVAFSPEGRNALTGGSRGATLLLLDLETGTWLRSIGHRQVGPRSFDISPDGRYALTGCDYDIVLYNVETGVCMRTFPKAGDAVALSPDGKQALAGRGGVSNEICLWNLEGIGVLPAPFQPARPLSGVQASTSERDYTDQMEKARLALQQQDFAAALSCVQKARSISGYEQAKEALELWFGLYPRCRQISLRGGWCERSIDVDKKAYCPMAFSPDSRYALFGDSLNKVHVLDIDTGKSIWVMEGHNQDVYRVAFSRDGKFALSGSVDTIRLWEVETGQCVQVITEDYPFLSADISPDNRYLVTLGDNRKYDLDNRRFIYREDNETLHLWDIKTGTLVKKYTIKDPGANVVFSPDGRYLITQYSKGVVGSWSLDDCLHVYSYEGHEGSINAVAYSPDGRYVLSGSQDKTLKLWNDNGVLQREFKGHERGVDSLAFSANGRFALSGSADGTMRLWDVQTGDCLRVFTGGSGGGAVAFGPQGRYALSDVGKAIRIWALDWDLEYPQNDDDVEEVWLYLLAFLDLHTPYTPDGLARDGTPTWEEDEFNKLMNELADRGYSRLSQEAVRSKLKWWVGEQ
jgi:WD40 repeat protein/serine/threonine protein kinase